MKRAIKVLVLASAIGVQWCAGCSPGLDQSDVASSAVRSRATPIRASAADDARLACRSAPVDGRVLDAFRPPAHPWLAGNRGIEYAATPGTPVRAVADGRVSFAGPVGGRLVVSIVHADGLRSTYSPLGRLSVHKGVLVARGDVVGEAAGQLHLGVLRGSDYVDPSAWLAKGCRAVLVPLQSGDFAS